MSFNKKILCIGNNGENTDQLVTDLAQQNSTKNHGLVDSEDFDPLTLGYYHTSIADLSAGAIIRLAKKFDLVKLLDQPKEQWSHWKLLTSSYYVMRELDQLGLAVEYRHNQNIKSSGFFTEFVKNNKSFCIYPWIEKNALGNNLVLCNRSAQPVTTLDRHQDWKNDPHYKKIRETMLRGERLPEHCKTCYEYEDKGIESYRQFETKDWVSKLNINSLEDLDCIDRPYYYEVRLNNKCNLACRGCNAFYSSRIEAESRKFNFNVVDVNNSMSYSSVDIIDKSTLNPDVRVYLSGGEPTVMVPVYRFMQECIDMGKTDFDFTLGTNAAVISDKFLKLADHFTNMNFSVSLDGYGRINDYWRWGSQWEQVIANTHELQRRGHNISINCVPGIYNVTNLHLLLEFLDREFPRVGIYLQINFMSHQSAYNHPNAELVVESMERCMKTNFYYTDGKSMKTTIDSLHQYYSKNPGFDKQKLKKFFDYNDQLDRVRNSRLGDYIPELEACRKYIL